MYKIKIILIYLSRIFGLLNFSIKFTDKLYALFIFLTTIFIMSKTINNILTNINDNKTNKNYFLFIIKLIHLLFEFLLILFIYVDHLLFKSVEKFPNLYKSYENCKILLIKKLNINFLKRKQLNYLIILIMKMFFNLIIFILLIYLIIMHNYEQNTYFDIILLIYSYFQPIAFLIINNLIIFYFLLNINYYFQLINYKMKTIIIIFNLKLIKKLINVHAMLIQLIISFNNYFSLFNLLATCK